MLANLEDQITLEACNFPRDMPNISVFQSEL